VSGVEIDALLEMPGQAGAVEGDDPTLFDDEVFDDSPGGEGGAADGRVLALGGAVGDEMLTPFLGQDFGEAIAGGGAGVHGEL